MAKSKGKHHKAGKSDASGEAEVEQPPPDQEDEVNVVVDTSTH
ncbi:unnamed protein product [Tenebrio molitor]|jgi:hypothetical protein|nr:unnamed protein product [Tenebrio molitor]